MKKRIKKIINRTIIIVLVSVFMLPVNAINNNVIKKAKASAGQAEVFTLSMLLTYIISMVAQQNEVQVPFPKINSQRTEFLKWYGQNSHKLNAMLGPKTYSYMETEEGETYYTPITYDEVLQNWETIDLERVVIMDAILEIDMPIMSEATELLEEFYDVPELSSVKPTNTPLGNKINIKGTLEKNNVLLADSVYDTMENVGMFSYPYISVIKQFDTGVQQQVTVGQTLRHMNAIYIITSKYPFIFNRNNYDYYVGNIEARPDNVMKITKIQWNVMGHWQYTIPLYELEGIACYEAYYNGVNYLFDLYDIGKNVLYTTFNVYYSEPTAYNIPGYFRPDYIGQMKQSSLTYRTFLESKYGPLIRSNDEVIIINIDNWLEYDKEGITWNIDNIANTDEAIDNLKVIDDEASRYGDDVISPEIVLFKDYIDEIDMEKYQSAIEVQGDIQEDFNNTYNEAIPTDVDIPENILNGLLFVAFVFGEMWSGLGEYNFILIFSATIGAIALLIGLGKQINDRGNKSSSKPSKPSKKSK